MKVAAVTNKEQAHGSASTSEVISEWWDDELHGAHDWVEALAEDVELTRERARLYDLIGSRLRGDAHPTHDMLDGINARLDQIPAAEHPGRGNVISLDAARTRRLRRVWQGAIAASLFAAVTAVGLTLSTTGHSPSDSTTPLQASAPTENDRAVMASLHADEVPAGASPVVEAPISPLAAIDGEGMSSKVSNRVTLPDWARGGSSNRSDPYVVTHYRTASPEFGTVMPEARAAAFARE